jgi:hypothetical protein
MSALPLAFENYPTNNGALQLSNILTAASLSSDQNNYNPTGFATAGTIRLTSSVPVNITGIGAMNDGECKILHNIGSNNITLKNASGSSTSGNQFAFLTGDIILGANSVVAIQYDLTSTKWRAFVPIVTEANLNITNVTTGNVSNTAHGFAPITPANAALCLNGAGAYSNPVALAVAFAGSITPATLTGDQNDYSPGISVASCIRLSGGAADRNITGLSAGSDGQLITITNIGTTNALILVDQSASSLAANRFLFGANKTISSLGSYTIRYDGTGGRWRPFSG